MTEEFGQRRCQFVGQFGMRCYEVHSGPQWQKDCVQHHKGNFGNCSPVNPTLVKILI